MPVVDDAMSKRGIAVTRRAFLAGTGAALLSRASRAAGAAAPVRIGQQPLNLGDGGRDGLLYVPQRYKPDAPIPLVLMLHGAGSTSLNVAYTFPIADELGAIVLAPDSRDEATWDLLLHGYGDDVEFIGLALKDVYARCAVDRSRMAIAGHSDGASYALSLGLGTGDTFGHVMAFSPGVMQPAEVHGKPKIFISHGLSDPIMPIDVTSRRFVPRLKRLGYDVTFREYEGRHGVPPAIVHEAFEWFMR
jgi:phospholipase/carboxylesterase